MKASLPESIEPRFRRWVHGKREFTQRVVQVMVLVAGVGLVETFSGACATDSLWRKKNVVYQETVQPFRITTDHRQLVVLGKQYHYIFEISPNLKTTLGSSFRQSLHAEFSEFRVSPDNKVSGVYTLRLPVQAPESEKKEAMAAGFVTGIDTRPRILTETEKRSNVPDTETFRTRKGEYVLAEAIYGTRYSAANFKNAPDTAEFNKRYTIRVIAPESSINSVGKILLTPVTVTADGLMLVGVATSVVLSIPIEKIVNSNKQKQSSTSQ